MELTTTITILSLVAITMGAPIAPSTIPRALGDGSVNVARHAHDLNDVRLELVDESSHFSVGKRMISPFKRTIPIEYMNDPAVDKAPGQCVGLNEEVCKHPTEAGEGSHKTIMVGRDA